MEYSQSKFLSTFDILFHYEKRDTLDPEGDYRSLFRDFSALYDLSLKILNVQAHSNFNQLVPHLKKLNNCNISQNTVSKITDQDANKIIELYLAALCMRFCKRIKLDHPERSKGDNPDVIADIEENKWGFACKTIHTKNTQTIYENIVKAVDQIEKSSSIIGIPVINLKNVINHEAIWPENTTFPSINEPMSFLFSDITSIQQELIKNIGVNDLKKIYIGKKSLPGVLFIAHSASSVFRFENMSPTATRFNTMNLFQIDEEVFKDEHMVIFNKLNHYMQLAN